MNGREMTRKASAKQTKAQTRGQQNMTEQTDERKCRQKLTTQAAEANLRNNGNNAKDNVD